MKENSSEEDKYRMRTRLIHGARHSKCWDYDHHIVPPISASAAYRLESVHRGAEGFAHFAGDEDSEPHIYIYDRLDEPTRGMLEENLASAEGGEIAVCFATGMSAVTAALGVATASGDEIVAHHTLYGCTYSFLTRWLPRWNVNVKFVDLRKQAQLEDAITDDTRVIYLETPVNPTLDLIDISSIRSFIDNLNTVREKKIILVVDNTFATPYCQRPLTLGADLVVESLTKDIGGFGTDMGGVVVSSKAYREALLMYRKDFGAVLSPRAAWPILVYGLSTLASRMVNQQKSALKVAEFLEAHPRVQKVIYPGLHSFPQYALAKQQMRSYDGKFAPGSMIYFTLKNGSMPASEAAERFIDYIAEHAYSITLAVSLGQIRTLVEVPYFMTHAALPESVKQEKGMEPAGMRLSIGLEDWHDIIRDLDVALNNLEGSTA